MKKIYIILALALIWVAAAYTASGLRIDSSITSLLPHNLPQVAALKKIDSFRKNKRFVRCLYRFDQPMTDTSLMNRLSDEIETVDGVTRAVIRHDKLTPYHLRLLSTAQIEDAYGKTESFIEKEKLKRAGLHIDLMDDDEQINMFSNIRNEYLASKDKRAWLIRVFLSDSINSTESLNAVLGSINKISSNLLDDARLTFTGGIYENFREKNVLLHDLTSTLLLCLAAIALVMLAFLRSLRKIAQILTPLLFALTVIFAIAKLIYGSLNMQTVFVGVVLAGLGIDFGIHITLHRGKRSIMWRSLTTACATTALAYLVLPISSLPGITQIGIIASMGMVIIFLSYLVFNFVFRPQLIPQPKRAAAGWHIAFAPALSAMLVIIIIVGASSCLNLTYEGNIKNMSSRERIDDKPARSKVNAIKGAGGTHVLIHLDDMNQAIEFERQMKRLGSSPEIRAHGSMGSLLERDEVKETAIDKLENLLLVKNRKYLKQDEIVQLSDVFSTPGYSLDDIPIAIKDELSYDPISGSSVAIVSAHEGVDSDEQRLRSFEKRLASISLGNKPIVPTQESFLIRELTNRIRTELPLLIVGVVLVILTTLIISFRSIKLPLLTLVPLLGGMSLMIIAMRTFGITINPFNLSILPVLIGIGVDDGIYIVNHYRHSSPSYALQASFPAITLTSITSAVGFGSLLLAHNVGLYSVGLVGVIGITSLWLCTVIFLPAILELYDRLKLRKASHY